jgi:hypothetical protein
MAANDPSAGDMESNPPTEEGKAAAPTVASGDSPQPAPPADEFDPMAWEVPLICKDCQKGFQVPYRHFQAGVVFHCPHCRGSFVPKTTIYRTVRDAFESFYSRRRSEREAFMRDGGNVAAFARRQDQELAEFRKVLDRLAHEMRPAGKMVRPRGLGAMFT